MDKQRKCYTFIWKIKDFSFSYNSSCGLDSPNFFVRTIYRTEWNLLLHTNSPSIEGSVVCRLKRKKFDSGPTKLDLDYELSFISGDGSIIYSQSFLKKTFGKDHIDFTSALSINRDKVFFLKKDLFLPKDTLTIQCRMWLSQEPISEAEKCSVESRIFTARKSFVGKIEKFSNIITTESKNKDCIISSEKKFRLHSLFVGDHGKLHIEIEPLYYEPKAMYKLEVFILDSYKNKIKASQGKIYDRKPFIFPLAFSGHRLLEDKELFLTDDVLTLQCEVTFSTVQKLSQLVSTIYEYDSQDIPAQITNPSNVNSYSEELHYTDSSTTLKNDMISLFKEEILCDIKVKTATETFSAHKAILSARSSVFKSMFTTAMREKMNNCVDIVDLDADTVRQMLFFLYSGSLENLEYKRAKSLYFAADKYDLASLKNICSNFLKRNLLFSNCCDILLLADKHQDKDLKTSVQDFIVDNDDIVFSSDEWKYLEENHPRLTTETFRAVYIKNKKK